MLLVRATRGHTVYVIRLIMLFLRPTRGHGGVIGLIDNESGEAVP